MQEPAAHCYCRAYIGAIFDLLLDEFAQVLAPHASIQMDVIVHFGDVIEIHFGFAHAHLLSLGIEELPIQMVSMRRDRSTNQPTRP